MKRLLISIINFYQKLPLSSHSMCRYVPTCSSYAKESIKDINGKIDIILWFSMGHSMRTLSS